MTLVTASLKDDTNKYAGVMPATRLTVLKVLDDQRQHMANSNFSQEDYIYALRYLLVTEPKYQRYITEALESNTNFEHDLFYLPENSLFTASLMANSMSNAGCNPNCCRGCGGCNLNLSNANCSSGDQPHILLAICLCIVALIITLISCIMCSFGLCMTAEILNNREHNIAKFLKIFCYTVLSLVLAAIALQGMMVAAPLEETDTPLLSSSKIILLYMGIPLLVGSGSFLLLSCLSSIECFIPKKKIPLEMPSLDLLAELGLIKELLDGSFLTESDSKEDYREFVKEKINQFIIENLKPESSSSIYLDTYREEAPLEKTTQKKSPNYGTNNYVTFQPIGEDRGYQGKLALNNATIN